MKIDKIELWHVAVPLGKPFYPSWIPGYPQTENRFTLLQLTTDDGIQGLAAGTAFENERSGLGGLIGPYLMGLDPQDIPTARRRLREVSYLGWRNNWMEAAFWDIQGKASGKPVWELFGGEGVSRAQVYASLGEERPPEQRVEDVQAMYDRGFRTVKLRVHSADLETDLAQLEAVCKAHGDKMDIGVDANQGWPVGIIEETPVWDLKRAKVFADACADLDIKWIEEPLDMYAYDDLAELRKHSRVPIAGAELCGGWHEMKVMMEKGCFDIYQPDSTMGGGITEARIVREQCDERGLKFTPHSWTNGLGFLINLHVYASGRMDAPFEYPFDPPGWVPEGRDGILDPPIYADKNGTIPVPAAPGFGFQIDKKKLRKYGTRFFTMTPTSLAVKTIREKGLKTALELQKKKANKA
jgi:L-alanine-DL-glutamate epimerase-like enolase superfamily enzyme